MSGRISIAGLGPIREVPMLPDSAPFVVTMPAGGTLTCVLSAGTPAGLIAPTLTASDAVSSRVWTLTASATGTAPITFALAFTVDGSAVALTPVVTGGTHVWTYTSASSAVDLALAWTLTVTNAANSDTASGSRTIPADLAPATAPGLVQPGSWSLAATAPGLVQPSSWSIAA